MGMKRDQLLSAATVFSFIPEYGDWPKTKGEKPAEDAETIRRNNARKGVGNPKHREENPNG